LIGTDDMRWLLASDSGYGFFVSLSDLHSRNKAGKAALRVPAGGEVVIPAPAPEQESFPGEARVAAVSSTGRLLVFTADELPELARGKGNKILGIPSAKYRDGEERMVAIAVLSAADSLEVHSGQRRMTLKPAELERYFGNRGRRGSLLPRGWRKVERLSVPPATAA
jgi:topoisomerase-4 subunit A